MHPEHMVFQSSIDENVGRENGMLYPNNLLLEKKNLSFIPSSSRKKLAFKLSFKRNDEHTNPTISEFFYYYT